MKELLTPEITEETVSPPEPQALEAEEAVPEEAEAVLYDETPEAEAVLYDEAPELPEEEDILAELLAEAESVFAAAPPEEAPPPEQPQEPEPTPEAAAIHEVDPTPIQKLLAANIGHYISCEFFIGDRQPQRREGLLIQVGDEYLTLLEEQSDAQTLCNIHHAKFITIYAKDDVPGDRFRQPQGRMSGLYPAGQSANPGQGNRRPYRR